MLSFGKVITEQSYQHGNVVNTVRRTNISVAINSRQQLLDYIFDQLKQLQDCESVAFEVFADKHTHEPIRIVVTSEEKL